MFLADEQVQMVQGLDLSALHMLKTIRLILPVSILRLDDAILVEPLDPWMFAIHLLSTLRPTTTLSEVYILVVFPDDFVASEVDTVLDEAQVEMQEFDSAMTVLARKNLMQVVKLQFASETADGQFDTGMLPATVLQTHFPILLSFGILQLVSP